MSEATKPRRAHEWKRGDPLTAENLRAGVPGINEILKMWPWVLDSLRRVDQLFDDRNPSPFKFIFPGKILATTQDGTNRWKYDIIEQAKASKGYGGWADGGRVVVARNLVENQNDGAGVEGNGVDHDGADIGNFDIVPAPVDCIVWVHEVSFIPTDDPDSPTDDPLDAIIEYWFQYENADDGTC